MQKIQAKGIKSTKRNIILDRVINKQKGMVDYLERSLREAKEQLAAVESSGNYHKSPYARSISTSLKPNILQKTCFEGVYRDEIRGTYITIN